MYLFSGRKKTAVSTFQQRLDALKTAGFTVAAEASGKARVNRDRIAAIVEDLGDGKLRVDKAGLTVGAEIAELVSGGFQMFWRTPSGKTLAAQAPQLKALHAFEADLTAALGLTTLYNEALGTTSDQHLYDRVAGRDHGDAPRPWERSVR